MKELSSRGLIRLTLAAMLLAAIFNAVWPAQSRLARWESTGGARTLIPQGERVRGVLILQVQEGAQRSPHGWTLQGRMRTLDGAAPAAGEVVLRLFVPTDFSARDPYTALRAPALPGDQVEVFARLVRYPQREFWRLRPQAERMAALGVDARALALEPIVVTARPPGWRASLRHPMTALQRILAQARARFEGRMLRHLAESAGAQPAPDAWDVHQAQEAPPPPDQTAALALALTTANRSFLHPDTVDPFTRTATSHLLAISGLHLGVLATLTWWLCGLGVGRAPRLLRRFGRRRVCGAAVIALLGCYVVLIGAPVSAVRAWVTLSLGVGALLMLRPLCPFHALAAAALLLILNQPAVVVDLGFQLSFAATLGILLFLKFRPDCLNEVLNASLFSVGATPGGWMSRERWAARGRKVGLFVGVSVSATLSTTPILAAQLGEVSLCGIWVNLVVTPFVSAVLFPVLVAGALGSFVLEAPGFWVMGQCCEILGAMGPWMDAASRLPAAVWVTGSTPVWATALLGAGALGWVVSRWRPRRLLLAALLLALGLGYGLLPRPAQRLQQVRIHHIPVGQGDATLLEFPDATTMLIDAGGSAMGRDPGRFVVVPYLRRLGIWRLDWVLATHADIDHIGGLAAVIDTMRPRHFIVGDPELIGGNLELIGGNLELTGGDSELTGGDSELTGGDSELTGKDPELIRGNLDPPGRTGATDPGTSHARGSIAAPMRALIRRAEHQGAQVHRVRTSLNLEFGPARVHLLQPPLLNRGAAGKNETSLVTWVDYAHARILLTGDLEAGGEAWLIAHFAQRTNVLKVGHHGSKTSSTAQFLDAVQPEFAVISAAEFSPFGHPHPSVVARLGGRGVKILQTALHGLIRVDIHPGGRLLLQQVRKKK